jgi:hypothetical protein
MNLQTIISTLQSFFNYYLFECLTMRTKPQYTPVHEEEEILYLNQYMTMER